MSASSDSAAASLTRSLLDDARASATAADTQSEARWLCSARRFAVSPNLAARSGSLRCGSNSTLRDPLSVANELPPCMLTPMRELPTDRLAKILDAIPVTSGLGQRFAEFLVLLHLVQNVAVIVKASEFVRQRLKYATKSGAPRLAL